MVTKAKLTNKFKRERDSQETKKSERENIQRQGRMKQIQVMDRQRGREGGNMMNKS